MFVLIRVLRYDGDIADAYDDDELDVIFANQREQPGQDVVVNIIWLNQYFASPLIIQTTKANAAVRQAYERLISGKSAAAERRDHDADCPICMENMADDAIELLAYCSVCGQNIHRQCYAAWTKTAVRLILCGSNLTASRRLSTNPRASCVGSHGSTDQSRLDRLRRSGMKKDTSTLATRRASIRNDVRVLLSSSCFSSLTACSPFASRSRILRLGPSWPAAESL